MRVNMKMRIIIETNSLIQRNRRNKETKLNTREERKKRNGKRNNRNGKKESNRK